MLHVDPLMVLFGASDKLIPKISTTVVVLLAYYCKEINTTILENTKVPSVKLWLEEMVKLLLVKKKNSFFLLNKLDQFDKIWFPLLHFLIVWFECV